MTFIQTTLNTDTRTGQGEVEMMLYLHELGSQNEWVYDASLIDRAKSSMPTCAPYMPVLAEYVKEKAGQSSESEILDDLNNFLKAFACDEKGPLRTLGGEIIVKVNSLRWSAMRCPRVKNACLMTNLASSKVSDGICKLFATIARRNVDVHAWGNARS